MKKKIAVMYSIHPDYCFYIATGLKIIEVRKTRPRMKPPFKAFIYCTKAKERFSIGDKLYATKDNFYRLPNGAYRYGDGFDLCAFRLPEDYGENNLYNGKVIGEFICEKIEKVNFDTANDLCLLTQVTESELLDYAEPGKPLFLHYIKDLKIYEKPKALDDFVVSGETCDDCTIPCNQCKYFDRGNGFNIEDDCSFYMRGFKPLQKAPQSWGYVYY